MRRLVSFLKPYRLQLCLGPAFKLVEAIFELIVPLVMADMIDHIPQAQASGDVSYLWQRFGVLLLLATVGLCSTLVCQLMACRASQGFGTDLRRALFHHINLLSWRELDRFGTATLITRMSSDVNQLQLAVAMLIRLVVRAPFLVIGAVIMAMRIDLRLSLVFLAIVPLVSAVLYLVMSRSVPFFKTVQAKTDRVALVTRENLAGARVVRAFRKQQSETERFDTACDDLTANTIAIGRLNALLSPFSFLVLNFGIVAILWFGGKRVDSGILSQGQIVAFVNYMTQILLALVVVANLVVIFTKAAASAARVCEVMETVPSIQPKQTEAVQPVPGSPAVRFEQVSFHYHQGAAPALRQVSADIPAGQFVGVIGGTGASKSTLAQLIPRMYDPDEGAVLVGGVDVRDYPDWQLRQAVGMVPQGNLLFSGTIRSNLLWRDEEADDEALWAALETAQAADFVRALPLGLDAPVAQGGANFSGGQRQRLTIARALVGQPAVLILDDASSALDYATDAALQAALRRLTPRPAVLLISQRISTVRHCDSILVMEEGRLVGHGTHSQLLDSCPAYQEICASQMKNGEVA